jgi:Flp pilus assembly pilin Flp
MLRQLSHIGGAATPNDFGGYFRRDQAQRPQDQSAPLQASSPRPPDLSRGKDARAGVRVYGRREVNQMLKLFTFVQVAADTLRRREEGQTMAEYGVVLAVITLAVIGAITLLSDNVRNAIESVANILP